MLRLHRAIASCPALPVSTWMAILRRRWSRPVPRSPRVIRSSPSRSRLNASPRLSPMRRATSTASAADSAPSRRRPDFHCAAARLERLMRRPSPSSRVRAAATETVETSWNCRVQLRRLRWKTTLRASRTAWRSSPHSWARRTAALSESSSLSNQARASSGVSSRGSSLSTSAGRAAVGYCARPGKRTAQASSVARNQKSSRRSKAVMSAASAPCPRRLLANAPTRSWKA